MIRRTWATIVATAGTTVLLTVTAPLSAQASTGIFRYSDAHGMNHSVTDPTAGACLRALDATHATNDTNEPIKLYSSPDCRGSVHTMGPGEDFPGDFNSAQAVF